MAAVRYDFCVKQGAKHTFKLDKKDGFGNPKSLVNYLGKIKIKKRHSSLEIIGEAPITFLDAPNGKMEIVIPETMFNGLQIVNPNSSIKDTAVYDLYLYKLERVDPESTENTEMREVDIDYLLEGTITISAKV
jgi:hypothetical protein